MYSMAKWIERSAKIVCVNVNVYGVFVSSSGPLRRRPPCCVTVCLPGPTPDPDKRVQCPRQRRKTVVTLQRSEGEEGSDKRDSASEREMSTCRRRHRVIRLVSWCADGKTAAAGESNCLQVCFQCQRLCRGCQDSTPVRGKGRCALLSAPGGRRLSAGPSSPSPRPAPPGSTARGITSTLSDVCALGRSVGGPLHVG